MTRQRRKRGPSRKTQRWLPITLGLLAAVLIGGGIWAATANSRPVAAPVVNGAPRVAVAQKVLDLGDVKVDTPVEAVFRIRNIGDQPLSILESPRVELVEGC